MSPYNHRVNTHHRQKRANKTKKISKIILLLIVLGAGFVGVDWLLGQFRAESTVVSSTHNATVQSAQINIFQSPYFRFQADDNWREVSDELNLSENDDTLQYLYRRYDKNFIDHELWITVNLPDDYKILRHNIPTRVIPVRIESDGTLTQLNAVSKPCVDALPKENPNLEPHVVTQNDIEYFCHPNQVNDYHVTVGVPGGSNRLSMPHSNGDKVDITLVYRNTTAAPTSHQFEKILSNFKSL